MLIKKKQMKRKMHCIALSLDIGGDIFTVYIYKVLTLGPVSQVTQRNGPQKVREFVNVFGHHQCGVLVQ